MGEFWNYIKRGFEQEKDMNDKAANLPIPTKNSLDKTPASVQNEIDRGKKNAPNTVYVPDNKPQETKSVEKKNSVVKDVLTTEKGKKENKKESTFAENVLNNYGTASEVGQKAAEIFTNTQRKNVDIEAERDTKDNVKRLTKYLGGGIVGQIADTVGIYGDMVSTAKHNLAQAYFQAAGKGGQYKDPISKDILAKKINTMIDSVAGAIKENNTRQSENGFRLLGMTQDEAYKIYGKNTTMIGKWLDTANTPEEAALMADLANTLKDDPRMNDPVFVNGLYVAMKNPEEKIVLASAIKGDPELADEYLFANEQLAMANSRKGMAEAKVSKETADSIISMTNASNEFKTAYDKMQKDNVAKKFDLELQQLIAGAKIMNTQASDAEINNRINAFAEKYKKYGVAREQIAGTVKDAVGVVKDAAGAVGSVMGK